MFILLYHILHDCVYFFSIAPDRIGRTYGAVLAEAKKLGLKRKRKIYPQQYRNRVKVKPREVQDASYTNICASVLDGDSFEKIARETNRPVQQVKEIYEAGVRKGRLAAIKRYRADGYAAAKSRHYDIPKGFKWQGCKNG